MPLQFTVDRSQAGCRLDRFLAEVAPEMSRRRARRLISDGCVFVGGARVRVQSRPLPAGSVVTFEEPAGVVQETQPAARSPIPRLRRGPVVGAAKPSFMPTEPTRQGAAGTLSEEIRLLLRSESEPLPFFAAVHRLDHETSGLVLFALTREVAADLSLAFREGAVERAYLAVVEGEPSFEGERMIDVPIAQEQNQDGVYAVGHGREAQTGATVLAAAAGRALLSVRPLTGRSHQIRAHLASIGHPVVGDLRYGAARVSPRAFGLHALALTFVGSGQRWAAAPGPAFRELLSHAALSGALDEAVAPALRAAAADGGLIP